MLNAESVAMPAHWKPAIAIITTECFVLQNRMSLREMPYKFAKESFVSVGAVRSRSSASILLLETTTTTPRCQLEFTSPAERDRWSEALSLWAFSEWTSLADLGQPPTLCHHITVFFFFFLFPIPRSYSIFLSLHTVTT